MGISPSSIACSIASSITDSIMKSVHEGIRNAVNDDAVMKPLAEHAQAAIEPLVSHIEKAYYIQAVGLVTTQTLTIGTIYWLTRGRTGCWGGAGGRGH